MCVLLYLFWFAVSKAQRALSFHQGGIFIKLHILIWSAVSTCTTTTKNSSNKIMTVLLFLRCSDPLERDARRGVVWCRWKLRAFFIAAWKWKINWCNSRWQSGWGEWRGLVDCFRTEKNIPDRNYGNLNKWDKGASNEKVGRKLLRVKEVILKLLKRWISPWKFCQH